MLVIIHLLSIGTKKVVIVSILHTDFVHSPHAISGRQIDPEGCAAGGFHQDPGED